MNRLTLALIAASLGGCVPSVYQGAVDEAAQEVVEGRQVFQDRKARLLVVQLGDMGVAARNRLFNDTQKACIDILTGGTGSRPISVQDIELMRILLGAPSAQPAPRPSQ